MVNSATVLYLKYGRLRLTVNEAAIELGIRPATIRNQISDGSFPINSYKDGKRRYIDLRDLSRYLDERYKSAANQSSEIG